MSLCVSVGVAVCECGCGCVYMYCRRGCGCVCVPLQIATLNDQIMRYASSITQLKVDLEKAISARSDQEGEVVKLRRKVRVIVYCNKHRMACSDATAGSSSWVLNRA